MSASFGSVIRALRSTYGWARPLRRGWRVLLALGLVSSALLAGCASSGPQKVLNVGLLLGSGGLGDRSFNDSAYNGLLEAQKKYNIRFETVNFGDNASNLGALRNFANNGYDLIIGVAFENLNSIVTVAKEFPESKF